MSIRGHDWTKEMEQELLRLYNLKKPNPYIGAKLGKTENAIKSKLYQFKKQGLIEAPQPVVEAVPSASRPIAALLEDMQEAYERKALHHQGKRGIGVTMPDDGPYAIAFCGDPHVDDAGCDIEGLAAFLALCNEADRTYVINMGDLTNNWIGRLSRLYAHQPNTDDEGVALMEWLLTSAPWLMVVLGNHDKWGPTAQLLCQRHGIPAISHGGVLNILSGTVTTIVDARHTHRGHSQYNPAFAQAKENYRGNPAHIIIGGHTHTSASCKIPNGVAGVISECIRVGAWKKHDDYAESCGFHDDNIGPYCLCVVDPSKDGPARVHTFWDFESGQGYLDYLVSRWKS